jgi:hypothetical protein
MTRLAFVALMVLVSCLNGRAQEPKPAITELEGRWRETMRAGEDEGNKIRVVFSGEKVTINLVGEDFAGTFRVAVKEQGGSITFELTMLGVDVPKTSIVYNGAYLFQDGSLYLLIRSTRAPTSRSHDNRLDLAPLAFRLEKLDK